jgi:hypothetical protein
MEEINWDKAMGPDLLLGSSFKDEDGKNMILLAAFEILNNNIIPQYLKQGILFLLSKNGTDICNMDELRPIVLLCFITKVVARTIYNRIKNMPSAQTLEYQYGFKAGKGTQDLIGIVVDKIFNQGESG